MYKKVLMIATVSSIAFVGATEARDQIRIVGSTTVYPFATVVAEQLAKLSTSRPRWSRAPVLGA